MISGFKAIVLWFSRERMPLLNGGFVMFGALGAVAATAPTDILLGSLGWRHLFELLAAATAACAILTFLVVPDPDPDELPRSGLIQIGAIFRERRFWGLAPLSTMCIGTAWAFQGLWAAPWMREVEGLQSSAVVSHLFVMALALSVGSLLLGICTHRLQGSGIRAQEILTVATSIFVAAEVALVVGAHLSSYFLWSVVAVLGGATVLSYVILAAYFPPALIGQANAALSTCHIGGAFILQYGIGFVVGQWHATSGHYPPIAYHTALVLVIVMQLAALAWFGLLNRFPASSSEPLPKAD